MDKLRVMINSAQMLIKACDVWFCSESAKTVRSRVNFNS